MKCLCWYLPLLLVLVFAAAPSAPAADSKREVTLEQARLLTEVNKAEPAAALELLRAYKGDAHPLITLTLAQTHWRLMSTTSDAAAARLHREAAEKAYTETLKLDATLRQAHLGLAQCAAAREDWITASREAAAGVDPSLADRGEVTFLAHAALRAQDWRLASIAAQQGILRFPDDNTLRRIEVTVLQHAGRAEDVRQAVLALLAKQPDDADLWRHLAWAAQETRRDDEALAALEAAVVLKPTEHTLRRALAEAQLARGLAHAAVTNFALLIGEPPNAQALGDAALMLSASRAAAESGALAQGRAWLAAIPESGRTRPLRLQSARLAVQAGDEAAAASALDTLIALGEQDANVLAWAGSLAESAGDLARAEALYLKASGSDNATASAASLRLVALYLKQERIEDARSTLATHLAKRPDDQQAKALQAQLDRRAKPR
ncbi:MAG: tetratricopeptide repeat protein [Planctomycetes bacterium]|nr:tetratricopeptide repeat protein [Planctomycetota bacterium]